MASPENTRWLIAGLGNPGPEYAQTRHNVGFMLTEALGARHGISGKGDTRFQAITGTGTIEHTPVVLAQPVTFMNRSGEAVARLMGFYKVPPERLLVVYDEAALPFGRLRLRPSGSAAGHNGIKSVIQALGGRDDFARLRVGIGTPAHDSGLHHHVLSRFSPQEAADLPAVLAAGCDAIALLLAEGMAAAMNRYNPWVLPAGAG